MKEISRSKKLEVAQHYILSDSYSDIEEKTGVSHGSVANIVKELADGKLELGGSALEISESNVSVFFAYNR